MLKMFPKKLDFCLNAKNSSTKKYVCLKKAKCFRRFAAICDFF